MNTRTGIALAASVLALLATPASGLCQTKPVASPSLPIQYEELTAPQLVEAVARSGGVCIIPMGILEKHGPHLPLGTDLLSIREVALRAARQEYSVVFPQYFCGQIFEAKHQPGTIAYSTDLIWKLLQETCDELARNGFKKIILANGHGGNRFFTYYFCQAQLEKPRDYSVVLFVPGEDTTISKKMRALRQTTEDGHAGESETSEVLAFRPDLVHLDRAKDQSGENLHRLDYLPFNFEGIWWYARYPNHYSGDGSYGKAELGELYFQRESGQLAKLVNALKKDTTIEELQRRFFEDAQHPLNTKQ